VQAQRGIIMKHLSSGVATAMRVVACGFLALGLLSCGGGGGDGGSVGPVAPPPSPLPEPAPANSGLLVPYFNKNTLENFVLQDNTYKLKKSTSLAVGTNPIAADVSRQTSQLFCIYTANEGSNNVSIYAAEYGTPNMTTSRGVVAAGKSPSSVAVNQSLALVTNFGDNTVSRYAINATTCALTPLGTSAVGDRPSTINLFGSYAVVTTYDNKIQVYAMDPATGALTAKGAPLATGLTPFAVSYWDGVDGKATVFPVVVANLDGNSVSVYAFNATTGALSKVGADLPTGNGPGYVWPLILPNAKVIFYVANTSGNSISSYEANLSTQTLSAIGPAVATQLQPFFLAQSFLASTINKYLYAFHEGTDDVSAYEIDQSTGGLKPLGTAL
jgi:6-phosphogluconolactonase (cycloisomerase 2 family)